jgi:PKD domain
MLHRLLLNLSLAATALTLAALASPRAAVAGADVAQVTVIAPGGAQQTLSLEALAGTEDVRERAYALRADSGQGSQTVTGFSLARILDAAGADPYAFSFLEVQRPAGGAVLLSRAQALGGGGDGPPVVFTSASGTGFLRPSAGAEDLNAGDSLTAPQGIAIVLRKGAQLKLRASASPRRVKPGLSVDFEAVVEQAGAGEQLVFSWYFDDGASAAGAEASHSFARPGSYDVVVGVTSDGSETGASAVVTIQVGAPLRGPSRKGGGTNEQAGAPDHGAATRPPSGTDSSREDPATATVGTPNGPARRSKPQAPPGDLVEGELVGAETALSPQQEEQVAARAGQLDGGGGGSDIPAAAWGLLVSLGLLGAGAAAEAGGVGGIRLWRGRTP